MFLEVNDHFEKAAIILICPAENHQGSSEHCHAVLTSGLHCMKKNSDAVAFLREHLAKAKEGTIRYSTNAQAVMAREIATRERLEAARKRWTK